MARTYRQRIAELAPLLNGKTRQANTRTNLVSGLGSPAWKTHNCFIYNIKKRAAWVHNNNLLMIERVKLKNISRYPCPCAWGKVDGRKDSGHLHFWSPIMFIWPTSPQGKWTYVLHYPYTHQTRLASLYLTSVGLLRLIVLYGKGLPVIKDRFLLNMNLSRTHLDRISTTGQGDIDIGIAELLKYCSETITIFMKLQE